MLQAQNGKRLEIVIDEATDAILYPKEYRGITGRYARLLGEVLNDLSQIPGIHPEAYVISYLRHHPDGTDGIYDSEGNRRLTIK
mgnify:CR=1 FL=1